MSVSTDRSGGLSACQLIRACYLFVPLVPRLLLRFLVQVFLTLSIWIFVYAKIYLVFDSRTVSYAGSLRD